MPETYPTPVVDAPSEAQLEEWAFDSVCEATDGCDIELDGVCEHGYPSWFIQLGLI